MVCICRWIIKHESIPTHPINGCKGTGAYPSNRWVRSRVPSEEFTSPSQGQHRIKQRYTLTLRVNLEASINLTCMFVDCGRDETTQGESMHTQGEHANSTQRSPSTDSNQEPSCCEVTVLTPTPLCYPQMTQREEKTPQRNRLWGRKFKNKAIASLVEGSVTWEMTTESNAIFYTETDR